MHGRQEVFQFHESSRDADCSRIIIRHAAEILSVYWYNVSNIVQDQRHTVFESFGILANAEVDTLWQAQNIIIVKP
jgi:hypothetical protein